MTPASPKKIKKRLRPIEDNMTDFTITEQEVLETLGLDEEDALYENVIPLIKEGRSAGEILDILHS